MSKYKKGSLGMSTNIEYIKKNTNTNKKVCSNCIHFSYNQCSVLSEKANRPYIIDKYSMKNAVNCKYYKRKK